MDAQGLPGLELDNRKDALICAVPPSGFSCTIGHPSLKTGDGPYLRLHPTGPFTTVATSRNGFSITVTDGPWLTTATPFSQAA